MSNHDKSIVQTGVGYIYPEGTVLRYAPYTDDTMTNDILQPALTSISPELAAMEWTVIVTGEQNAFIEKTAATNPTGDSTLFSITAHTPKPAGVSIATLFPTGTLPVQNPLQPANMEEQIGKPRPEKFTTAIIGNIILISSWVLFIVWGAQKKTY